MTSRILITEISRDLGIGKGKVYEMLESKALPGMRVGRTWIVTRYAYERWKQTCGVQQAHLAQAS